MKVVDYLYENRYTMIKMFYWLRRCAVEINNWVNDLNNVWNSIINEMDLNEETTKDYVIKPFLKNIGYDMDSCWYKFEHNLKQEGRIDIYIELKERRGEGIYVEAKRGDEEIKFEDIKQTVNYLCSPDYRYPNIKWGILTNGKEFYLINKDIVSENKNDNGEAV